VLKEKIGKVLVYRETSMFGPEYKTDGSFDVFGPSMDTMNNWYAVVTMKRGLITKVD
jgi:hypothetical protein